MTCSKSDKAGYALVQLAAIALGLTSLIAAAQDDKSTSELARALREGSFDFALRYRYEHVDQETFALDANASLLRTRLTYTSADFRRVSFLIEVDDLRAIVADDYNSTRNGKLERPVVADPEATDLNQLYFTYATAAGTRFALGRQRLELPSRRFVASLNWRLNEQTFDAFTIARTFEPGTDVGYAYITNVNRPFGPDDGVPPADLSGQLHVFDATRAINADLALHGYGYLLDFDDAPELSSATIGLRLNGSRALAERIVLPYAIEYARQRDYADNPFSYGADYVVLQTGLRWPAAAITAGLEILEGRGLPGEVITTPLAGLNGMNGWADQFLTIPDDGLEDATLRLDLPLGRGELGVVAHTFSANHGGSSYGRELDVEFSWPLAEGYALLFRVADYRAETHGLDTVKTWLMLSARF